MDISNLTRYKFEYGQDSCDCTMIDSSDYDFEGGYVKFEDIVEFLKQANNKQSTPYCSSCLHGPVKCQSFENQPKCYYPK